MSSLIFFTDETQALVATDTLVINASDNSPKQFCSKSFFLPHLNTIIAATGIAGFVEQWIAFINSNLPVCHFEELISHSQSHLSEAFQRDNSQITNSNNFTVTIYHFGYSNKDNKIKGYASRSTNNFEPELLEYGTATKPPCKLPEEYDLIKIIPDLMNQQRIDQQKLPENERLYIGGEIHAMHLSKTGCNIFKISEFNDFQLMKNEINKSYNNTFE